MGGLEFQWELFLDDSDRYNDVSTTLPSRVHI
jgi:hypothetical protein